MVLTSNKNPKFLDALQGARSAEAEIVRLCTARLRAPHNETMRQEDVFLKVA
jgi:hypothetical protein